MDLKMKLKKTTPRLKKFPVLSSRSKITGGVISALVCLCVVVVVWFVCVMCVCGLWDMALYQIL